MLDLECREHEPLVLTDRVELYGLWPLDDWLDVTMELGMDAFDVLAVRGDFVALFRLAVTC